MRLGHPPKIQIQVVVRPFNVYRVNQSVVGLLTLLYLEMIEYYLDHTIIYKD